MSIWKRLQRAVSSNLERFRDDPLGVIKADLAGLTSDLATVKEQLRQLELDEVRLEAEEERLNQDIRAALKAGDRERGLDLAQRLSEVRRDRARLARQIESTRRVVERAEGLVHGQERARREIGDAGESDDPVIKVRAKETLSRLERELAAPEPGAATKSLGGGSELAAEPRRGPVTKTLAGSGVEPRAPESVEERVPPRGESSRAPRVEVRPVSRAEDAERSEPAPREAPAQSSDAEEGPDLVAELERLAQLKERGVLSDEEFLLAKQRLLGTG